jgi:steroid delta-isomerase-like uncharacterized protein
MTEYDAVAQVAVGILEAWNDKDYERGARLLSEDFEVVEVATGETFRGASGLLDEYRKWHTGLSDGRMDIQTVISSGDQVAVETIVRGTHDGVFALPDRDIPPSGNQIAFRMCTISVVRDGKEVQERHYFDNESLLKQLGAE